VTDSFSDQKRERGQERFPIFAASIEILSSITEFAVKALGRPAQKVSGPVL
jgi:hypothetical protein